MSQTLMTIQKQARDNRQATARAGGAVGKNAVLPTLVLGEVLDLDPDTRVRVLDFGAGPNRRHVEDLNRNFESVGSRARAFGYDLGDPRQILTESWDIVYASNVLNVQETSEDLFSTLQDLWIAQNDDAELYVNYPKEPRKMGMTAAQMRNCLELFGWQVERVKPQSKTTVWKLTKI